MTKKAPCHLRSKKHIPQKRKSPDYLHRPSGQNELLFELNFAAKIVQFVKRTKFFSKNFHFLLKKSQKNAILTSNHPELTPKLHYFTSIFLPILNPRTIDTIDSRPESIILRKHVPTHAELSNNRQFWTEKHLLTTKFRQKFGIHQFIL